jgi:hypothetical protein
MTETWYLLYGGDSVDGCGPGEYEGRTRDVSAAAKHHIKISNNPYSTGYVQVITDKEVVRYSSILGYSPATSELKEAIKQQQEDNS